MTTLTSPTTTTTLSAKASLGDWIAALKVAGAGIGTRPPVPILSGVLIEAKDYRVTVTGFNYETAGVATVGSAYGVIDGRIAVNYKMLLDILTGAGKRATKRVSDSWDVVIAEEGRAVTVNVNGSKFNLSTMPVEEFPTVPELKSDLAFGLDSATFIRRMDSALISVSKDDTLPILTGVRMELAGGTLALLSTDRYRLTLAEMPLYGAGPDKTFLLSSKAWKAFKKVLNAKGGEIRVEFPDDRWITFQQGNVKLATMEIDGEYPRIRSLFPDSVPVIFEMDADLLAACVATVSVVAERNTPVRFTYNGLDSLRVDAGTGEEAHAEAFMPYNSPKGNRGFTVAFNPTYLTAALKDMKGQIIQFHHNDNGNKPANIVGAGTTDVQHLVMPVRLPSR